MFQPDGQKENGEWKARVKIKVNFFPFGSQDTNTYPMRWYKQFCQQFLLKCQHKSQTKTSLFSLFSLAISDF